MAAAGGGTRRRHNVGAAVADVTLGHCLCFPCLQVPGATTYLGCVGKDHYADELTKVAAQDGVQAHYMIDEATPTGTCAACIVGGERSLVANLAAANNYKVGCCTYPAALLLLLLLLLLLSKLGAAASPANNYKVQRSPLPLSLPLLRLLPLWWCCCCLCRRCGAAAAAVLSLPPLPPLLPLAAACAHLESTGSPSLQIDHLRLPENVAHLAAASSCCMPACSCMTLSPFSTDIPYCRLTTCACRRTWPAWTRPASSTAPASSSPVGLLCCLRLVVPGCTSGGGGGGCGSGRPFASPA